jgi:hypothetical protein
MCDAYRGSSLDGGLRDGIKEKRALPRDMKKKCAMPTAEAAQEPSLETASKKKELCHRI